MGPVPARAGGADNPKLCLGGPFLRLVPWLNCSAIVTLTPARSKVIALYAEHGLRQTALAGLLVMTNSAYASVGIR